MTYQNQKRAKYGWEAFKMSLLVAIAGKLFFMGGGAAVGYGASLASNYKQLGLDRDTAKIKFAMLDSRFTQQDKINELLITKAIRIDTVETKVVVLETRLNDFDYRLYMANIK